jgi:hypothetical protein
MNKEMTNKNWPIETAKLRNIPVGEPFICMLAEAKIVDYLFFKNNTCKKIKNNLEYYG